MSRTKEELHGITELGSQHTVYGQDYDPAFWKPSSISIPTGTISSNSTARNLPACAR